MQNRNAVLSGRSRGLRDGLVPCAAKVARTVLRGWGNSNVVLLLDQINSPITNEEWLL